MCTLYVKIHHLNKLITLEDVQSKNTLKEIKYKILSQGHISLYEQRYIVFKNKRLIDNSRKLSYYNIKDGDTIIIYNQLNDYLQTLNLKPVKKSCILL